MEKEKIQFVERRIKDIITESREAILEGARLEICETKETIADFLDMFEKEEGEIQFNHSIGGVWGNTIMKIKEDRKAGKDFGEALDEITASELMEFIGFGALNMSSLREKYPNAFRPWTAELDAKLEEMWAAGTSYKDLVKAFGRNENAIKVRVVRLELEEKYGERPTGKISVRTKY